MSQKQSTAGNAAPQLDEVRHYLEKVLAWPQKGGTENWINVHWTFLPKDVDPGSKLPWTGRAVRTVSQAAEAIEFALKSPGTRDIYVCQSMQRHAQPGYSAYGTLTNYKPVRSAENAVALKGLWLDIDVKDTGKGYASIAEAITSLGNFRTAAGMPRPSMVVGSGGGVHVYWLTNRAMTVQEWYPLAAALVGAAKKHGLKCDTAVTTDAARVLRVPGTLNYKTDPAKPVKILARTDFDYMVEKLATALQPYKVDGAMPDHVMGFAPHIRRRTPLKGEDDLSAGIQLGLSQPEIRACLDAIPNTGQDWNFWNNTGMRVWAACDGADYGLEEWKRWSDKVATDGKDSCEDRWAALNTSPPTRTGAGALITQARAALGDTSWRPEASYPSPARATAIGLNTPEPPLYADPYAEFVGPAFPVSILPPVLADFVEALNIAMGADRSAIAMASLTAFAGAVNAGTKVRVGDSWQEPPIIWTALVGPPSAMKSPVIDKVVKPLREIDSTRNTSWNSLKAKWAQAKAGGANPGPCPARPSRCLLQDATAEKIAEILSRDPAGSLMVQDELAGLLGSFERYSSGASSRAFFLSSWNGGMFLKDRVGQGVRDENAEIRVDNLALGILGGIQPDRLATLRDLTSDGLLQRFLPVLMQRAVRGNEDHHVYKVEAEYDKLLRLAAAAPPYTLKFALDAEDVRKRVLDRLFELEQLHGFPDSVIGAIGKYKGYFARLALTLHLAGECGASLRGRASSPGSAIKRETAEAAEKLVFDFLLPHMLGLYDVVVNGGRDRDTVRAIGDFILASDKDRLRPSDITAGVRRLRSEPASRIAEWASRFTAMGWLRPDDEKLPFPKAWHVEPGLRTHFDRRRREAQASRAAAHAILKAAGSRR